MVAVPEVAVDTQGSTTTRHGEGAEIGIIWIAEGQLPHTHVLDLEDAGQCWRERGVNLHEMLFLNRCSALVLCVEGADDSGSGLFEALATLVGLSRGPLRRQLPISTDPLYVQVIAVLRFPLQGERDAHRAVEDFALAGLSCAAGAAGSLEAGGHAAVLCLHGQGHGHGVHEFLHDEQRAFVGPIVKLLLRQHLHRPVLRQGFRCMFGKPIDQRTTDRRHQQALQGGIQVRVGTNHHASSPCAIHQLQNHGPFRGNTQVLPDAVRQESVVAPRVSELLGP
mmetsp:Transcript_177776/g.570031  ORF Transcript_177776/g.570031 Transcript_177776/m.570031 type:complete len:280 (+) Transcript_177776:789-1628(+)